MATQSEIASRIISQLKTLDPSISAIIGTPERKIIDTVAEVLAQSQVDINMLNGAFDVDAKHGSDLENMLGLFGFGRQQATKAVGYVEFKRETASSIAVPIPAGTQLKAPKAANGSDIAFIVTRSVTLNSGQTMVIAPVECIVSGVVGNVGANTITDWNGAYISGIDSITNPSITYGGLDSETDEQMKARFRTAGPFRNLSGTKDQYLATALSTKSTKANVIGPVSHYKEYIQIPLYSDVDQNGNGTDDSEYTTALSTNLNSKYFYTNLAKFVSDDSVSLPVIFNENFDFIVNNNPDDKNKGDAYRNYLKGDDSNPKLINNNNRPNLTFNNVYVGSNNTVQTISPGDVLLFEHFYMSKASRNDFTRGILNCVDLFVNGSDETLATATVPRPGNGVPLKTFTDSDSYDAFYYKNFTRVGSPSIFPVPGNVFIPLPHQPTLDVPDTITVSAGTFKKNVHYWAVQEITALYGTVRARNGIEFSVQTKAQSSQDSNLGPYTGPKITDQAANETRLILSIGQQSNTSTSAPFIVTDADSSGSTFYSGTLLIDNEKIDYQKGDNFSTKLGGTSGYSIDWNASDSYKSGTLRASVSSSATTFSVDNPNFVSGSYLLIDNEIVQCGSTTGTSVPYTLSVTRGAFGTEAANHRLGAIIGHFRSYRNANENSTYLYQCVTSVQSTVPPSNDTSNWTIIGEILQVLNRGANSTVASSHNSGAVVKSLYEDSDNLISIENYIYDGNIYNLQSLLESNKQITTDALAHKARVKYLKPDVSIMYSQGSNPSTVNQSIVSVLTTYFENQYFGNTIQLSDILQAIHNVAGVDNVRWSKDALESKALLVDSDYNPRNRLSEVGVYGDSPKTILQQIQFTDKVSPTKYKFYLSTDIKTLTSIQVSRPSTNSPYSDAKVVRLSSKLELKPNTTYSITSTNVAPSTPKLFKTGSLTSSDQNLNSDGSYNITLDSNAVTSSAFLDETASITEFFQGQITFVYGSETYQFKIDTAANGGSQLTTATLTTLLANIVGTGGSAITATYPNNLPTIDNPYTITYQSANDTTELKIVNGHCLSDESWSYNDDFLLGDDELAALPVGITNDDGTIDIDSIITIRTKAQNTWNQI